MFGAIPLAWDWRGYGEYLERLARRKSIAIGGPSGWTRIIGVAAMGFENRGPDPGELTLMKRLLREALEEGAFGMCSGLIYPPGVFSQTPEMVKMCKLVTGMRQYLRRICAEKRIWCWMRFAKPWRSRQSGVSTEISHHRTTGKQNWGKCKETLRMVDEARDRAST